MRTANRTSMKILCAVGLLLFVTVTTKAQKVAVRSRVVDPVDDSQMVRTQGNVHPFARAEFDRGPVADSQPMNRMLLLLQRSTEQETSLRQLMDAQLTKSSAGYHSWLTPEQFGAQFGPSDADMLAVTDWLTRQGFQIAKVAAGRNAIEFNGNAAQVRSAFQTDIHKFAVHGREYIANVSNPAIPAAITPVVQGVVALNNFPKESYVRTKGEYRRVKATGELKPLFTYGDPANFALAPADFATIYNIPAGADGTGQSIAVIGQSNIVLQDITDFRHLFGLDVNYAPNNVTVILNGPDPGVLGPNLTGDEGESDLDLEWAGGLAPGAKILFVASQTTMSNGDIAISQGVDLSALYAVDNNLAPVLTESYGGCEFDNTSAGNQFYNLLWEQAAAQGITVVVSAGDNGSAGCDNNITETAATGGLAVSGTASTAFNVAVGGTDFDPSTLPVAPPNAYWGATNSANQGSALAYIPEITWDDSVCAINFPTACSSVDSEGADLLAGSGGISNCAVLSSDNSTCKSGNPQPAYQVGVVPTSLFPVGTAATRVIPDVSFFASNGQNHVAYIVCEADANPGGSSCDLSSPFQDFQLVGGTSAAAPAFAAVMALVNQKTGERQGNANYVLYGLAASSTIPSALSYKAGKCGSSIGATPAVGCVYNDVTKGNNSVACEGGSPNCSASSSTPFGIIVSGSNPAYNAGQGYDAATGLGTINVGNLLTQWSLVTRSATTTTLGSPSPASGVASGTSFSVPVTVTPAPPAATGEDVSLIATTGTGATFGFGPFPLAGGTVSASTNLLPPGTTSIAAYYSGDATHAPSSASIPYVVTGAGKTAQIQVYFVGFDANGNPLSPTTHSQTITYGSSYILKIAVTDAANGTTCEFNYPNTKPSFPCPTGTVTLTDGGQPLNDFPNAGTPNATNVAKLNNLGIAEDQPVALSATVGTTTPGVHTIVATYAGDANYAVGAPSNTLSITVQQASTQTAVASSLGTITSGTTVALSALVATLSDSNGPTGSITFSNGSASLGTGTCVPTSGTSNTTGANGTNVGTAYCIATLTTAISSLYPAPVNQPKTPLAPFVLLAVALVIFLALIRWMPENRRRAYSYAGLLAFAILATVIAGCGGGGGGSSGGSKTVNINAAYPGDVNYTSSSGSTTITVTTP
jgi:Pro-kumamolisin, activation domain